MANVRDFEVELQLMYMYHQKMSGKFKDMKTDAIMNGVECDLIWPRELSSLMLYN